MAPGTRPRGHVATPPERADGGCVPQAEVTHSLGTAERGFLSRTQRRQAAGRAPERRGLAEWLLYANYRAAARGLPQVVKRPWPILISLVTPWCPLLPSPHLCSAEGLLDWQLSGGAKECA